MGSYFGELKLAPEKPKDQKGTPDPFPSAVDLVGMSELDPSQDWNLVLIAASPDEPARVLRFLAGAISACGGWILNSGACGETCAEIDFEFSRANCVEIYSILLATGVDLSAEAHTQLTELCQCTSYLLESRAYDIVRLHLTVYTRAMEAWEQAPGEAEKRKVA